MFNIVRLFAIICLIVLTRQYPQILLKGVKQFVEVRSLGATVYFVGNLGLGILLAYGWIWVFFLTP